MLIPLIFKNNDTELVKTKIGKVSSKLARMIYSFTLGGKVGILKDYGGECSIYQSVVGNLGTTTLTFNKGAVSVYGGIIYMEQGTTFVVPNVSNGSIGILIDLTAQPGSEAQLVAGDNLTYYDDDLQEKEADGKYYFELCKYNVTGTTFTVTSTTNEFIYSNEYNSDRINDVISGAITVAKSSSIVPSATTSNSASFYVGTNLIRLEW